MKPCPFCNGTDLDVGNWNGCEITVRCVKCGAMGPEHDNENDAKLAWNNRPREKQAFKEGAGFK